MALGGGIFTTQNKVLPGSYINVISKAQPVSNLGERGIVALPIALNWGKSGVFTVTAEEFQKNSMKIFGYDYTDDELKPIREVFRHAERVRFYNLNDGTGAKASCDVATAKYAGTRGNNLSVNIQPNIDDTTSFDVEVYMGSSVVYKQTAKTVADLKENEFVTWSDKALTATTTNLKDGANGTGESSIQNALNAFEGYNFNVLVCPPDSDETTCGLFEAYTKRLRDKVGVKFQTVIASVKFDYEGVVELKETQKDAIYWVAGALAGCALNKSCTNMTYDGEYDIPCPETQTELEGCIQGGIFAFHTVEDEVRVLVDINSLTTFTDTKGEMFSKNQVIRVADQCANDTAKIFNTEFLGKIQNDESGRISLWNRIVTHRRELETMRAIDKYSVDSLTVTQGQTRQSIVVDEVIVPLSSMEKLYMTIVID